MSAEAFIEPQWRLTCLLASQGNLLSSRGYRRYFAESLTNTMAHQGTSQPFDAQVRQQYNCTTFPLLWKMVKSFRFQLPWTFEDTLACVKVLRAQRTQWTSEWSIWSRDRPAPCGVGWDSKRNQRLSECKGALFLRFDRQLLHFL